MKHCYASDKSVRSEAFQYFTDALKTNCKIDLYIYKDYRYPLYLDTSINTL